MRILYGFILIILASCLSSRKADRQLSHLGDTYPDKVAQACTLYFPQRIVTTDTIFKDTTIVDSIPYIDTFNVVKYKIVYRQGKTTTIVRYYEDSAKIRLTISEWKKKLDEEKKKLEEERKKPKEKYSLGKIFMLLLLLLLFLYLRKKYKNENSPRKKTSNDKR